MNSFAIRRAALALALLPLAACGTGRDAAKAPQAVEIGGPAEMRSLIETTAESLDIPPELLDHVVRVESGYNPAARNGTYLGLMQIAPQTARTMGYEGPDSGLLDARTNLRWGGAYLRGAWIVANGNLERAYDWYRRGYYYEARDRGLLVETGLAKRELR
ncbi:lytic transglycosylase domain-containing protein [Rubellimicrobium roseum]|uniref:Lytic transglycosylase domain-containing protein n=1 Tax=Rubellimicrobium roseum TaxID=687525 RepID=A0A5C4NHR3_9RHOB|nr:lytic transglycosylase domain-containing protein [Rubellimicrobium roseum]TNC72576.1 lytic transglycosylase domain-containing protein [Rubellimicrobium roseum]